jgi:hypothetical protein
MQRSYHLCMLYIRAKEVSQSGMSAEGSGGVLHSYRFSIQKLLGKSLMYVGHGDTVAQTSPCAFFSASNVRFAVVLLPAHRPCAQLAHTALVSLSH